MITRVLLDTHVFVWALADRPRLPAEAWTVLNDASLTLELSVASAWELAIKSARGRITLPGGVRRFVAEGCERTGVRLLGVDLAHLDELVGLPPHHRDPFDRLIVAQARSERMALLSYDQAVAAYDVRRVG